MRRILVISFFAALVLPGIGQSDSPPLFEFTPPDFTNADKNQDERVDRDEQGNIIIERFDARDLNNDGLLNQEELPSDFFSRADQNEDKTVSKKEFMKFRFGVFERFDDDQNEVLDHGEYRRWMESQ